MKKCILCAGKLIKEKENVFAEHTCEDCNCLQSDNSKVIKINLNIDFYIANYGTNNNIEIFQNFNEAKRESIDNFVYKAILNSSHIYFDIELNCWNYEDKFDLFLTTPSLVKER